MSRVRFFDAFIVRCVKLWKCSSIKISVFTLLSATLFFASCTCNIADGRVYLDCYGDLIPCDNATYSIGSGNYYWDELYVNNIHTDNITLEGDIYNDLVVTMTILKPPASLYPTWRAYKQSQVPAFSDTTVNVLYFSAQLPYDYKDGSDLEFHIHLAYTDNNTGNSVWYFSYCWTNIDDTFPVEDSEIVTIASPEVEDYHQLAEMVAAIDGTGKEASSVLLCSIQRLGNHGDDTYPSEIYLLSGDFHYKIDKIGDYH